MLAAVYQLRLGYQSRTREIDRFHGWKPAVLSEICHRDGDHQVDFEGITKSCFTIDGDTYGL